MNLNHMVGRNRAMVTLGDVHKRVSDMAFDCYDKLIPVSDISFNSLDNVRIGDGIHYVRPVAQQEISSRLGIPVSYLKRCPEELQAENLNHWIGEEKNGKLFVRFTSNDVRAVFTERYKPVDNLTVIEKLFTMGYQETNLVQAHLDDDFMVLNIPNGDKGFSVNNDKMAPGISISNSEVGVASLGIAAYLIRLACTNGLIARSEVAQRYRHVTEGLIERFPEIMGGISYELSKQKSKLRISMESPVTAPKSTIESFNQQFLLTPEEKKAVFWGWQFEFGETMFNVINSYTKGAQHQALSAESSYRLMTVGGKLLDMVRA